MAYQYNNRNPYSSLDRSVNQQAANAARENAKKTAELAKTKQRELDYKIAKDKGKDAVDKLLAKWETEDKKQSTTKIIGATVVLFFLIAIVITIAVIIVLTFVNQ